MRDKRSSCFVEQGANILNLTDRYGGSELAPDNLIAPPNFDPSSFPLTPSPFLSRRKRDAEYVIKPEVVTGADGKKRKVVTMVRLYFLFSHLINFSSNFDVISSPILISQDCLLKTAKCVKITCNLLNMAKGMEATVHIKSRLWNSTLIEDYNKVDFVKIFSRAEINIPEELEINQDTSDDFSSVSKLMLRKYTEFLYIYV